MSGQEYEFESEQQLLAGYNGDFGVDVQASAERQMEAQGYFDGFEPEDPATEDALETEDVFEAELDRLQRTIGRRLTSKEIRRIISDLPQGEIPDLVEKYGDLKDRVKDGESRREFMAEVVEDHKQAQEEAESAALTESPAPMEAVTVGGED